MYWARPQWQRATGNLFHERQCIATSDRRAFSGQLKSDVNPETPWTLYIGQ